jgi:hypothetical protein
MWLLSRHKWQDVRVRAAQGTSYVDWGASGLTIGLAREREREGRPLTGMLRPHAGPHVSLTTRLIGGPRE